MTNTYTSVFVSPKNRCIETARGLGIISYEITNEIQEFNFGILDGVPFSKYSEIENAHLEKLSADPFYQLPEADNYKEFYKRITLFFKELSKKANNNDHYRIVTHGGIINTVITDILKVNP
ncbi:MAG: histidine phosphatase family protein [Succinivibrionaceae bacterium]